MESNYWTRPETAIRRSFIRTGGAGENYWARQAHTAWFARAQAAIRARSRVSRLRKGD
jgi:hypothetical protein